MNDFIVLSIAFGDPRYSDQLLNLKRRLFRFHPTIPFHYWVDGEMPPGAKPFTDSMYGFKVWAVNYARENDFKKIIWLDPACFLVDELYPFFDLVKQYGVVAAQDDNLLCNYCSFEAFKYFDNNRVESRINNEHLCGGSVYIFDFDIPLCSTIFEKWKQAEIDGMFGSQQELASGKHESHRNDESIMALSLYSSGSSPVPYDKCRYNDVSDAIIKKRHFK